MKKQAVHDRAVIRIVMVCTVATYSLAACGAARTSVNAPAIECRNWNSEEFFANATDVAVERCLRLGMDPNARQDAYIASPTVLHLAAQFGTPGSIVALTDAGADIDARADYGSAGGAYNSEENFTPLHVATLRGTPANIVALISSGSRLDDSVLLWGAARGTADNLSVLIDAGGDVDGALHGAVYGSVQNIRLLLDAGVDIEARDPRGRTPLLAAADVDVHESLAEPGAIVTALLEAGADFEARDREGWTPLHLAAAWSGTAAAIEALVDAGAEVDARGRDGWTALHLAATMAYDGLRSGNPDALQVLLARGARVEARDDSRQTPLHVAAMHQAQAWDGVATPLAALLEAGADMEARDQVGRTPLHLAAGLDYYEWSFNNLRALIDAGADIGARDDDGRTPLDVARGLTRLAGHPDNAAALMIARDFGDDSGAWPNDGECDDGRFTGEGMGVRSEVGRDASDCYGLFNVGRIRWRSAGERESPGEERVRLVDPEEPPSVAEDVVADEDFGDDSGLFPNDGECDDARFTGEGMGFTFQVRQDGTDCSTLLNAGRIRWAPPSDEFATTMREELRSDGLDFGVFRPFVDELMVLELAGQFMNKGLPAERSETFSNEYTEDQSEQMAAALFGLAETLGALMTALLGDYDPRDFGADSGSSANDGVCDDIRLTGVGTGRRPTFAATMADATDCRRLRDAGRVRWRSGPEDLPQLASALEASDMLPDETLVSPEDVAEFGMMGMIPVERAAEILRRLEQAMRTAVATRVARWLLGEE
ncbi:MAG: ankyrin repeat domain-containing protein [Acidobacteria bacterium]|nr:ankyrin repeat domain-containing protein [Acidobacteriota bacterium]